MIATLIIRDASAQRETLDKVRYKVPNRSLATKNIGILEQFQPGQREF